jgi:hypothetical protein
MVFKKFYLGNFSSNKNKKMNQYINTNLTESKYVGNNSLTIVNPSSNNKTPNFNYKQDEHNNK